MPFGALLSATVWLAGLALVRADLIVTQEVETAGGAKGVMTIQIKATKIRADLTEPVSLVFDAATGDTFYLQHKAHTFSRLTAAQSHELAEKLRQAAPPPGSGVLQPGGQKREISGMPTELFLWSVGGLKFRFWVARDFPGGEAMQDQLDRLQASGLAQATAGLMPRRDQLPGLRVRTEMELGTQRVAYTIVGVKEAPLSDALFVVPKGFTETPMAVSGEPGRP